MAERKAFILDESFFYCALRIRRTLKVPRPAVVVGWEVLYGGR